MKYAIIDNSSGLFVCTEIDSGGMSMYLGTIGLADTWDDRERAQWFIDNRLSERKDKRPYEVVEV